MLDSFGLGKYIQVQYDQTPQVYQVLEEQSLDLPADFYKIQDSYSLAILNTRVLIYRSSILVRLTLLQNSWVIVNNFTSQSNQCELV